MADDDKKSGGPVEREAVTGRPSDYEGGVPGNSTFAERAKARSGDKQVEGEAAAKKSSGRKRSSSSSSSKKAG